MDVFFDSTRKVLFDLTKQGCPRIMLEFFKGSPAFTVGKRNLKRKEYLNQEDFWGFRIKTGRYFLCLKRKIDFDDTIGEVRLNPIFFVAYAEGREQALKYKLERMGERYDAFKRKGPLKYCGYMHGDVFILTRRAKFENLWAYLVGYELGILEGTEQNRQEREKELA